MTGSPFEEGIQAGRRAYQDAAYASGFTYGLLAEQRGIDEAPPEPGNVDVLRVADGLADIPQPRLRHPPKRRPKLRPAQAAVLEAVRRLRQDTGPVLLEDLTDTLAATGRPMRRDNVRIVLNGLLKRGLVRRVATVGRTSNRPAWGYQAP